MQDKFLESIKTGFISQIEEIINEAKLKAKEDNLSAIDTLILINNNISSWISSINGMIHIDDELLANVARLKMPFVSAAKKEVAMEVSKIIENEQSNVTSKINDFINNLKKKGIDLDGDSKENQKEMTTRRDTESRTMDDLSFDTKPSFGFYDTESSFSSYDSEPSFNLGRQRVLKRENKSSKRETSDCPPDSCGGSSTGCGW